MTRFIIQRLGRSLITLWIVFSAVFFVLRLSGDPAQAMLGPDSTDVAMASFQKRFGLDQPLPIQYFLYLKNVLTGDLGDSMRFGRPVSELFMQHLPATLELALWALALATPG